MHPQPLLSDRARLWLLSLCSGWTIALVVLCVGMLSVGRAYAVPVLDARSANADYLEIDLRSHWQATVVSSTNSVAQASMDPQVVWDLPDAQFGPLPAQHRYKLNADQRLIGRLSISMQSQPSSLLVEMPMPRLDAVHLSYRYDAGPWTDASAGDRIAMVQWPFANRHPVFVIPAKTGQLHVVWNIAQQGLLSTPVYLRGDAGFREDRFSHALRTGALLGLALVLTLVALGAATIFQRFSFVAVALMTLCVGFAVFCQGGVAGVYLAKNSTWFNDVSKFVTGMLFGAMIPWTIAVVAALKLSALKIWRLSQMWLVVGVLAAAALSPTGLRDIQAFVLPLFLISSLCFAFLIAASAVLRKQAHAWWPLVAVAFYSLGILAPLAAYFGYAEGPQSFMFSSLGFLVSSLLLVYALALQYRHGRMVMTRAQTSHDRDVLTGLFNRNGFEKILRTNLKRIAAEQSSAAFLYIRVSDVQTLHELYGGEGFESGLVQIAAAVSSCVSVVDTVARISPNVFAVMVIMPPDHKLAHTLAQKIITRNMAIASHSTPMAQTLRIAMAWLPTAGSSLADIERRCNKALTKIEEGKRMVWVGGVHGHVDANAMGDGASQYHTPAADLRVSDELPSLPGVINSIEREMLGGANEDQLSAEAGRFMRVMDEQEVKQSSGA
jgi:diguanylate cyclase (GGDEF)-like protein